MKIILLLLLFPLTLLGQNTIALPDVVNYSKQSYAAGLQNWDITQDSGGIIYIANNEGLLSFDGRYWNVYPLPNKTIVRSVHIGYDHRIYVGGQDELGYFSPSPTGILVYHSLTQLISQKDKSFGDVWDILSFKGSIFFRTPNKVFKFSNKSISTYNPLAEWGYMGESNGKLYAHDIKAGLLSFENEVWAPIHGAELLSSTDITSIIPIRNGESIVTTLKKGFFRLSKSGIEHTATTNDQLFANERIYSATKISDDWIALATTNNGLYITTQKGEIIQSFSKAEGVQNNNVLSVFLDNQHNLWLGLDNGIDFIAYNSAIKNIIPNSLGSSGYSTIIHNNELFAATSNGLYHVPLQATSDLSFSRGSFELVANTKGQNWGLAVINNQLLLGHHEGAFLIKGNEAQAISTKPGFWSFVPLSTTFQGNQMIAGHYNGLTSFDYDGNMQFIEGTNVPKFEESSRFIVIDNLSRVWISHPYHGVYKLTPHDGKTYSIDSYTAKNGLPSTLNNTVFKVKNELVVATEKGIYLYNEQRNVFEPSQFYKKLLGDQSIRYLREDAEGNIWFVHDKTVGVVDISSKAPAIIYLPELNDKILSGFEFIYALNSSNIFLSGQKGFYHINYAKYKNTIPALNIHIRAVKIRSTVDSLLFGGYFADVNETQKQSNESTEKLEPKWNSIQFEYSSTLFAIQSNLEYSYLLKGFDQQWSDWTKRTNKEYTNLPPGTYTFLVKVRSNLGNESTPAAYAFKLLPPWYKTIVARILYLLLFCASVYGIYLWQKRKFEMQQFKYEEEQKRLLYIHELERNKTESELIALRNAKLEAEINFKNSELASSAMHLVKKGEVILKSKTHLSQVMKGLDDPQAISELRKMIKAFSEDDNMDQEWEKFAKHFDQVHTDFLHLLKEKHPSITPSELKLSAYLRMNLSTKEIAQLMNISVRGVEVSRYRLRKKLQIPTEVSLFNYLMTL